MAESSSFLQKQQQPTVDMNADVLSKIYQMFREGQEQLLMKIDSSLADLRRDLSTVGKTITSSTEHLSTINDQTIQPTDDERVESFQTRLAPIEDCTTRSVIESKYSCLWNVQERILFVPSSGLSIPETIVMNARRATEKPHINRTASVLHPAFPSGDVVFYWDRFSDSLLNDRWKPNRERRVWDWTVHITT